MNLCFLDMVRTCGALVEDDENFFSFTLAYLYVFIFGIGTLGGVFSMGVTFFSSMMYRKL